MVGMLTIPWTMTAELFPTEIRGIAHSISYSIANMLMFAALQSYRSLQDFLGGMSFPSREKLYIFHTDSHTCLYLSSQDPMLCNGSSLVFP